MVYEMVFAMALYLEIHAVVMMVALMVVLLADEMVAYLVEFSAVKRVSGMESLKADV